MPAHPPARARLGRRALLRGLAATVATPAMAELLSSCGTELYTTGDLVLASPQHPVRWPLSSRHPRIPPGQTPKPGSTLRIYNYADYLGPGVIKAFEKEYDVNVVVGTFNDGNEAMTKIANGSVPYDLTFPSYDQIGKLVTADLIRPLTKEYITHIDDLWPQFTDPWYDLGWRYTVPYTVYLTGIGWRSDMVDTDIGSLDNPYDVFWDKANRGNCAVIDDWHTTMAMVLLRNDMHDVNTGSSAALALVGDQLRQMQRATNPRVTITMYNDLPLGQYGICSMWSGDAVNAQYYLPKKTKPEVLRYWFPSDGRGLVDNDLMVVLASGENPVAAHLFIDYLLRPEVAAKNFGFIGYQPPQRSINPAQLVSDGYIPENLRKVTVRPREFRVGSRLLEMEPVVEGAWQQVWQEYRANG